MTFEELGARLDDWLHSVKLRRVRLMRRLGLLPKPTPEQIRAAEEWSRAMERIALFAPFLDPLDFPIRLPTDLEVEQALATRKVVTVRKWADLKCTVNREPLESIETLNWRWPPPAGSISTSTAQYGGQAEIHASDSVEDAG